MIDGEGTLTVPPFDGLPMPSTEQIEVNERDREVLEALRHDDQTLADVVGLLVVGMRDVPEVCDRLDG